MRGILTAPKAELHTLFQYALPIISATLKDAGAVTEQEKRAASINIVPLMFLKSHAATMPNQALVTKQFLPLPGFTSRVGHV